MRIILSGASGHMGRAVAEQAKAEGIEVLFGVDAAGGTAEFPIYVSFAEAPAVQDAAVIDFSRPDALEGLLSYAEFEQASRGIGDDGLHGGAGSAGG